MADFVLPQVRVFQRLARVPALAERRLPACLLGGHAALVRYAEADERETGRIGFYDPLVETTLEWPGRPAGSVIDQAYTKIWIKNALLRYYEGSAAGGQTIRKVSGYNNRVRATNVNFKANGATYPRDSDLLDRDVAAGDVVKVRGLNGDSEPVTLWTYVQSIVTDTNAAVTGAMTADAANQAAITTSFAVSQIDGPNNCITIAEDTAYSDGLPSGYPVETYDLVVTESSIGGDLSTAKIRVISGSGTDDVAEVSPENDGTLEVGTRGLVVLISADTGTCSESATEDSVSPDDLVAGQRFRLTVQQTYVIPTPLQVDDYTGAVSMTYIITVTKGGVWADSPQVTVTSTTGTDSSGPTTVSSGTAFAVGTLGTTGRLTGGTGLRLGDKFYIEVTGTTAGAYKTLVLGHAIDQDISTSTDLTVTLYIRKADLQVAKNRIEAPPTTNFSGTATEVTIADGITAYDSTWTDSGVEQPLPVESEESMDYGIVYVEYRAWLADLVGEITSVSIEDYNTVISGAIHPDNPLKYAASKAIANSNGSSVKVIAVTDPAELEDWATGLEAAASRDGIYGVVPLTRDQDVLELVVAHVNAMSNETNNLWRYAWVNLSGVPEIPIVSAGSTVTGYTSATTSDDEVCLCVVEEDPETSGTQYTRVRCTSGNSDFIANGVRAGDQVRLQFSIDGFGEETYTTLVVDEVLGEDEIRVTTDLGGPVSVSAKTEIWRTLSATAEAEAIGVKAGAYANQRVSAVWPDTLEADGEVVDGFFLCAALAGYASGVLPQQSLTHAAVTGFSATPRSEGRFNVAQRNVMSGAGVWVVEQDQTGRSTSLGEIFTRYATTTVGYSDQTLREEAVTRNVDSISYRFQEQFRSLIGRVNVVPSVKTRLSDDVSSLISVLQGESATEDLGGQLLAGTTYTVSEHPLARDRYIIEVAAVVPYALNNLDIYLTV